MWCIFKTLVYSISWNVYSISWNVHSKNFHDILLSSNAYSITFWWIFNICWCKLCDSYIFEDLNFISGDRYSIILWCIVKNSCIVTYNQWNFYSLFKNPVTAYYQKCNYCKYFKIYRMHVHHNILDNASQDDRTFTTIF